MLLFRLPPLPQESLSSWRQRVGHENGYWKYPRFASSGGHLDPDRLRGEKETEWLTALTTIRSDIISKLSLDSEVARISNRPTSTKLRWAISAREIVGKRAGPMCCPLCLASDPVPYFRIEWRLANITHCAIHSVPLKDHCSACGGALWPSPIRLTTMRRWLTLGHCQICGDELASQPIGSEEVDNWSAPSFRLQYQLGSGSYWDGFHTLSQLLLRKSGAALHRSPYVPHPIDTALDSAWRHIEEVPLHARVLVLNNCAALLENWPASFILAAKATGISKVSFSGLDLPSWMDEIVDAHLVIRRRNQFSPEYIQDKINAELLLNDEPSKARIRRSLGVVENSVLNRLMFQRRRAHKGELLEMMRLFRLELEHTSAERCKLSSLWRDYLIFLLSVSSQTPVMDICRWSRSQCLAALDFEFDVMERALAKNEARNVMKVYESMCAPHNAHASDPFFTSRFKMPLADHGVRQRVSGMMKLKFAPELWRSVDVFTTMFEDRRRSRKGSEPKRSV